MGYSNQPELTSKQEAFLVNRVFGERSCAPLPLLPFQDTRNDKPNSSHEQRLRASSVTLIISLHHPLPTRGIFGELNN